MKGNTMYKPIDEEVIPVQAKKDSEPCNCACSKALDNNDEKPDPKNTFAVDYGKSLIHING